ACRQRRAVDIARRAQWLRLLPTPAVVAHSGFALSAGRRAHQPRTVDEGSDDDDSLYDADDNLRLFDVGNLHQRRERIAVADDSTGCLVGAGRVRGIDAANSRVPRPGRGVPAILVIGDNLDGVRLLEVEPAVVRYRVRIRRADLHRL